jgi:hypothetical protein
MVIMIKDKFLHVDYEHNLCKQVQNLRNKETSQCEYKK